MLLLLTAQTRAGQDLPDVTGEAATKQFAVGVLNEIP
jgi:hypothetical protein